MLWKDRVQAQRISPEFQRVETIVVLVLVFPAIHCYMYQNSYYAESKPRGFEEMFIQRENLIYKAAKSSRLDPLVSIHVLE